MTGDGDRVLYVDGTDEQRPPAVAALREAGYAVTAVATADDAVAVLQDEDVDCVVSEYRLPDGDGLAFFDRIYHSYPDLVFVLYTGHGSECLASEAVAAGVDGYVPRSDGPETLVDRVERTLLMKDRRARTPDPGGPAADHPDAPDDRRILEALGDAVYALDEDGHFTSVNGRLVSASGYTREELLGSHVTTIMDQGDYEYGTERIRRLFDDEVDADAVTFEIDIVDKDDRRVPCEVSISRLSTPDGGDGIVGIVRDVTERKRMGRRLHEQKARIESLHRTASRLGDCQDEDDVYGTTVEAAERVLDVDGCAIHVADASETHLVPHTWTGEDDPRTYTLPWAVAGSVHGAAYRSGETRRVDDCRGPGPDLGDYRSLLVVPIRGRSVFSAVSEDPGAFTEGDAEIAEVLIAHVADALDRVAFEGELRTERDRFAALFENVPDPVVDADHDEAGAPIVRQVNPAFEDAFGYEESDVAGKRLDEMIVPQAEDARAEARRINERAREGDPVELEVQRRTTDGLRTFLLTVVPVEIDGESPRRFALYTDITERKQHEQRVEVLNRVLRHDLRNNMNIIKTATEALGDHVEGPGEGYLEIVDDNADELVALAEKTRTVQRTLDRSEVTTGPLDVVRSVERAVDDLREDYPDAEVRLDADGPTMVRADEFVDQAVHNVVENAIEHNDNDVPHVEVEVDPTPEGVVALHVRDDGPGLPQEERELLVEDREITQLRHASGLGLWLVNWLVTRAGGALDIADNDPRGTVVTIRLPAASVGDAGEATGLAADE